ncbi:DUF5362 family protein [Chitinophagaceae bacterium 26-R-25]|nr:DUF5362 family protein [Chitinophagaceae bacterium 26-R-25]
MENVEASLLDVNLTIDTQSDRYLRETAKWNKFLAILSFIFCGLMVLAGLFLTFAAGFMMSSLQMPFAGMGFFWLIYFLVFAVLTIIPNLYRYRFAAQVLQALDTNDQVTLTSSLGNLKSFYRFYGIMMIVLISIYVLIFLVAMVAGMMR